MFHVDVFTSRKLEGNQLAVFPDARGLSDGEMQALAKETNLSETTFVMPRTAKVEREKGVRVRIFTVEEELPFAGHPTLGTAWVLRAILENNEESADQIELELNVGKIPVSFSNDRSGSVFGEMRQRDPEFGMVHDRAQVARALGVDAQELADDVPIQTVSTGNPFAVVPFRSLSTLQKLRVNWAATDEYVRGKDVKFLYLVCRETVDDAARLHARMFFYNGEDPATGSAAGPAAAWMVRYGIAKSGERVMVEQGLEMQRPSQIFVSAEKTGDAVVNVRVGGRVVQVMRCEVVL